jgi:hypothetical protein
MTDALRATTIGGSIMALDHVLSFCTLASLQGALVVLPRPRNRGRQSRLRSPAWALVLPGALIVGTFGVLAVPGSAAALALLAAVATPVLGALAVLHVVPGHRLAWLAAVPTVAAAALALHSWPAALAASLLTALGCLALGAMLVRLTPVPWLVLGIAVMCVVDVVLIASGPGQPASDQMALALSHSPIPALHHAQIGSFTGDYPDLVLASVLGAALAGDARQLRAGVLVAAMVSASGLLFTVADILPGTVPVAVAAAVAAAPRGRR